MPSRQEVVDEARSWLGVPWRHQGRTRRGIDCAGVVVCVGRSLKLSDHDNTGYQRRTTGTMFLAPFREAMNEKPVADAKPGDVLIFRDAQYPCHSAIVVEQQGKLAIVHAHAMRRKVVEDLLDQGDWMVRRVACFEFRGIED